MVIEYGEMLGVRNFFGAAGVIAGERARGTYGVMS